METEVVGGREEVEQSGDEAFHTYKLWQGSSGPALLCPAQPGPARPGTYPSARPSSQPGAATNLAVEPEQQQHEEEQGSPERGHRHQRDGPGIGNEGQAGPWGQRSGVRLAARACLPGDTPSLPETLTLVVPPDQGPQQAPAVPLQCLSHHHLCHQRPRAGVKQEPKETLPLQHWDKHLPPCNPRGGGRAPSPGRTGPCHAGLLHAGLSGRGEVGCHFSVAICMWQHATHTGQCCCPVSRPRQRLT